VISSAGLASSPVEDIRNRLARMSRLDLNLQIRLIRLSLLSQVINFVSDGDIYCTLNKDSSVSEDQTILLKAISDMLIQTGISHMTPSRQWIGLRFDASVSKYIPDFVNDGLVNGRFGIALVLHLIGNILNSDLYKKQADAVIQDIANSLDGERVITSERFAGFNDGIGGICYGTRILKDNGITSEALNSLDTVLQSKTTLTIERTSRKNIRRLCMKAASYLSDRYELLHDVAFEGEHKFKRPDKNQRSLPSSDSENKLFYDLRKGIDQGHREDHTIGYLYNPVAMKERASHSADKCQIERLVHYAEIPGIRYGLAGCAYSLLKLRNDKLPDLLQRV
jgi:lantibiotic modifying enzyme